MNAPKYTLETCPDDLLLKDASRRGLIRTPADWHPTHAEIREHDCDVLPFPNIYTPRQIRDEIEKRGLNGQTATPW